MNTKLRALAACVALALASLSSAAPASAFPSGYKMVYAFCPGGEPCADGSFPIADPVRGAGGAYYGVTEYGGLDSNGEGGTIFALSHKPGGGWQLQTIYEFCQVGFCDDGMAPTTGLIADTQGDLYGVTPNGGSDNGGVAFELVPNADRSSWSLNILHTFCNDSLCSGADAPNSKLTYKGASTGALYDGVSPLYGTAAYGNVFSLTPGSGGWTYGVVYDFCPDKDCSAGVYPAGGIVVDDAGGIFINTVGDGDAKAGTVSVFKPARKGWKKTVLHGFCADSGCRDGSMPSGAIALDASGALIGTTVQGGNYKFAADGGGVLYKLSPSGKRYSESVLHKFCYDRRCSDGSGLSTGIGLDGSGRVLGTAHQGGSIFGAGTAFAYDGSFELLYKFCLRDCTQGERPLGVPVEDSKGGLLGTAAQGGTYGEGAIYEIVP